MERVLGEDWEEQLAAATTTAPATCERQALLAICLQGQDYSRLPKALVAKVEEMAEEVATTFPTSSYFNHCLVEWEGQRAGWLAGLVEWEEQRGWLESSLKLSWRRSGEWVVERSTMGHAMEPLVLVAGAEFGKKGRDVLMLLDSSEFYTSLSNVSITKVEFTMDNKTLQVEGSCVGDGKRFILKSTIDAWMGDCLSMNTRLYEEDQSRYIFITNPLFHPSKEVSLETAIELQEDMEARGWDGENSSGEEDSLAEKNSPGEAPTDEEVDEDEQKL